MIFIFIIILEIDIRIHICGNHFLYNIEANDLGGIASYYINDTENFVIDGSGNIAGVRKDIAWQIFNNMKYRIGLYHMAPCDPGDGTFLEVAIAPRKCVSLRELPSRV